MRDILPLLLVITHENLVIQTIRLRIDGLHIGRKSKQLGDILGCKKS